MDVWYTAKELYKTIKQKIIQRLQSEDLRSVTNTPWYVSKFTLHSNLQIPFVIEEIQILSTRYHQSILGHNNRLAEEISNTRRLRREWPSELPQPTDEEN
jgi:hypothetical protein